MLRSHPAIAACLLLATVPARSAAGHTDTAFTPGPANTVPDPNRQVIAPGRVRFAQTWNGRWIELVPVWNDGRSLISGGGFIVYADDADGRVTELANTSRSELRVEESVRGLRKCCEGMRGGFRAPSLDPDDDHDGRIDEDRLDGVDNDGDGAVDEDFAAIGDEMIVTDYSTAKGVPSLLFHQESYAWSLPHIDGAIMMSLLVRNTGSEPLRNVRIAAHAEKGGPLTLTNRELEIPAGSHGARPVRVSPWVAGEGLGPAVAVVAFPVMQGTGAGWTDAAWMGGYVPDGVDPSESIMKRIREQVRDARANHPNNGAAPSSESRPLPSRTKEFYVAGGASIFVVSPSLGDLDPGREVRVDLALIAVPQRAMIDDASVNALRTFAGDGTNRYLPPPVSMRPRVIWGSYRRLGDDERAVLIEFENLGDDPVSAQRVSYVSGLDAASVEPREAAPAGAGLVLRGAFAENLQRRMERITLKGRLDTGEFFEAILRPNDPPTEPAPVSSKEAETYWKTPGKLTGELLKGSPNPFRDATTITYEIPAAVEREDGSLLRSSGPFETSIKVYNVTGRLVHVLVDQIEPPGSYSIGWAAVDEAGNPVASGVYYVKLQIEKKFITKRLILLK